jgi:hypothetical protein
LLQVSFDMFSTKGQDSSKRAARHWNPALLGSRFHLASLHSTGKIPFPGSRGFVSPGLPHPAPA